MPRFRYQRGDKPLEGFTIEHGLGVGGFGEVYYAVSDSGREVALKAVQHYEEIELRGISQCMNLKSPHLVTVFDVKHNEQGQPFVIMEYVQGPSLRQLLDNEPEGLGPTKSAFFLREIAKGLSYLHDAGVVHRDLKPHNVFYEEGYVKIGDYSLCKMMSTSHRTGHTMTVGTVHYMAPEISEGRYDASVDIYALGVMVYEMLTGSPPFVGDSLGEVLMKHMTAEPNLAGIDEPFRSAVAKAIAKDPDKRFSSAAEFVEAIYGVEHVQNSVVEFNPQELTMVANQAAKRVLATPSGRPGSGRSEDHAAGQWQSPKNASDKHVFVAEPVRSVSRGDTNNTGADYTAPLPPAQPKGKDVWHAKANSPQALAPDVMHPALRYSLAVVSCLVISAAVQFLFLSPWGLSPDARMVAMPSVFVATNALNIALTAAVISVTQLLALRNVPIESRALGRIAIAAGLIAAMGLGFLRVPFMGGSFCVALPFVILNWHQFIHPRRERRLVLWPILASALMAFVFALAIPSMFEYGINLPILCAAVTAGVGLWLQIASPKQLPIAAAHAQHATMDYRRGQAPAAAARQAAPAMATGSPVMGRVAHSGKTGPVRTGAEMLRGLLVIPGNALFAVSSILAVLELSSSVEGVHFLNLDTIRILAAVGFGLVLGCIGLMIASGTRREWSFLRLIAATGILAALHYSCLSDQMSMSPLYLPAAVVLFAWPAHSSGGPVNF